MTPTGASGTGSGSVELDIAGMTCQGCASAVTRVLSRVPGVSEARVDLASSHAWVRGSAPVEALLGAVKAAGYEARVRGEGAT